MALRGLLLLLAHAAAVATQSPACPGNTTIGDLLKSRNLSGKLCVVTGGDSGLGLSTARAFAEQGATVIIATHNQSKGEAVAQQLAASSGSVVRAMLLDLSSLVSVRQFAASYLAEFGQQLHLLVNNAGIGSPSKLSKDGYELVFEVDYLGHFLLTELLLPALRKSSPSRVVNVASGAHENACETAGWPEGCFSDFTYLPPPVVHKRPVKVHYRTGAAFVNSSSYGVAKFLQVQHATELALREQGSGVAAFSLTPGFALTSMTDHVNTSDPQFQAICQQQRHPSPSLPPNPCPFTADQGAAVVAYSALLADVASSGAYFSRTQACGKVQPIMHGMTPSVRAELYTRSQQWVALQLRQEKSWGRRDPINYI